MIALWSSLALGASLEEYARSAPVILPELGITVIEVPGELLDPVFGAGESDVVLVDANGTSVPLARVVAGTTGERVFASVAPVERGVWRVADLDRFADSVVVRLPQRRAATVTVFAGDVPVSEPTRVWNLGASQQSTVLLDEARMDALRVEVVPDPPAVADFSAEVQVWTGQAGPRASVRSFPVIDLGWIEGGAHRYEVAVPADLPISAVLFDPAEDVFQREVGIARGTGDQEPGSLYRPYPSYGAEISRRSFGGSKHDQTRVGVPATPGDRLELTMSGDPPLTFDSVGIEVPGLWVLARDAGPGPHRLYGSGPAAAGDGDLQIAADELLRLAATRVVTGEPEPNPAWRPPEVGISEPGVPADLARMTIERDVTGAPGLAAIPLDAAALARARSDLGDLRLVAADGGQIPFLLRERPGEASLGEVAFERTESGRRSRLRVKLDDPNLPVSSITLTTSANAFSREVRILRPRATQLEPVRAWTWTSNGETSGLTLALYERFGDELVIEIHNGDDAPLPIETVVLRSPAWELVTVLPEGGATLVYGDPRTSAPSYDLFLVRDRVLRRTPAVATLGDPRSRVKVAPLLDQALAIAGVAVLALGLLVLVVAVLRGVPAPATGPSPAPEPEV